MKVFVTGATGFVGSAVVEELIRSGHKVIGLTRSADGAEKLKRLGASAHRGSLEDLESLRIGAASADGVINCAFNNDLSQFAESSKVEKIAIETLGKVLRNSDRPLIVTSGVALMVPGRMTTENDARPLDVPIPRDAETPTLALAKDEVRAAIVRLSPVTHGEGGGGFAGLLTHIAREKKVSAYVGSGENRWPAVHYRDAARLFVLALETAVAGSRYHAVAEQGVMTKEIATAIGHALKIPTLSITKEQAADHFGFFKDLAVIDTPASSDLTRKLLGWQPTHIDLITDLKQNLKP